MEETKVGKYKLANPDKVLRALDGSPNDKGMLMGGVRNADGNYDDAALLAEYDRIGGLILLGEDKVKIGSFYDFANRKPLAEPKVMLSFRVNGELVEVAAEDNSPKTKAIKKATKKSTKKAAKKTTKKS